MESNRPLICYQAVQLLIGWQNAELFTLNDAEYFGTDGIRGVAGGPLSE